MKPEKQLRISILRELVNTPSTYLLPEDALRSTVKLLQVPPPTDAQITAALDRLEEDAFVHCEISPLRGKVWCITGVGRAALAEIPA